MNKIDYLQINVTRQSDGDIITFDDKITKIDCASLNATCSGVSYNERETNRCDKCKCLPRYTTFVSRKSKCMNLNEMTTLKCRIHRQRQTTVIGNYVKAIRRPIRANSCRFKDPYPAFYSGDENTDRWIRMTDVKFLLKRQDDRRMSWLVKFEKNSISKMVSKYAGKIVRIKVACRMRQSSQHTDLCILFKIAGSVIENSTLAQHFHDLYYPYTITTTTRMDTTNKSPGNNTFQNKKSKSGKNDQVLWIIITTVLLVLILTLIGIISCICLKRRKNRQPNEDFQRTDVIQHDYDIPMKSSLQNVHGCDDPEDSDHIYATVSERNNPSSLTCSSPHQYQELNFSNREKSPSHYQPLVHPDDLQYVDVLPDQSETSLISN